MYRMRVLAPCSPSLLHTQPNQHRFLTIYRQKMKHSTPRVRVLRNQLDGVRSLRTNIPLGFVCGIEMAHPDWKLRDGVEDDLKRLLTIHSTPTPRALRNKQPDGVRSEQHHKRVHVCNRNGVPGWKAE